MFHQNKGPRWDPWLRGLACPAGLSSWSHSAIQATRRGAAKSGTETCSPVTTLCTGDSGSPGSWGQKQSSGHTEQTPAGALKPTLSTGIWVQMIHLFCPQTLIFLFLTGLFSLSPSSSSSKIIHSFVIRGYAWNVRHSNQSNHPAL